MGRVIQNIKRKNVLFPKWRSSIELKIVRKKFEPLLFSIMSFEYRKMTSSFFFKVLIKKIKWAFSIIF